VQLVSHHSLTTTLHSVTPLLPPALWSFSECFFFYLFPQWPEIENFTTARKAKQNNTETFSFCEHFSSTRRKQAARSWKLCKNCNGHEGEMPNRLESSVGRAMTSLIKKTCSHGRIIWFFQWAPRESGWNSGASLPFAGNQLWTRLGAYFDELFIKKLPFVWLILLDFVFTSIIFRVFSLFYDAAIKVAPPQHRSLARDVTMNLKCKLPPARARLPRRPKYKIHSVFPLSSL
jgi:hypothetical protein